MEFNMPIIYIQIYGKSDRRKNSAIEWDCLLQFLWIIYIVWFSYVQKKVSENHWCEEIKKTCDVKIYVINSVPPDDEIQIFLDQNILDLFLFSPEFEIFF